MTPPTDGPLGAKGTGLNGLSPRRHRRPQEFAPRSPFPGPPVAPLVASDLEADSGSLFPGPLAHHPASRTIPLPLHLFPSALVPVPPFQLDPEAGAGAPSAFSPPHPRPRCGPRFRFPDLVRSRLESRVPEQTWRRLGGPGSSRPAALLWPPAMESIEGKLGGGGHLPPPRGGEGRGADLSGAGLTARWVGLGGLGGLCRGAWRGGER